MTQEALALTIPEAAEAARISRARLYEAIRDGELALAKVGRRSIVLRADLAAWLASKRRARPTYKTARSGGG